MDMYRAISDNIYTPFNVYCIIDIPKIDKHIAKKTVLYDKNFIISCMCMCSHARARARACMCVRVKK
jgi:hypothetical protein